MKIFIRFLMVLSLLASAGFQQSAQSQILSPDLFGLGGGNKKSEAPSVTMQLTPKTAQPGDEVTLSIHITLPPKGYTYSMTKGLGGTRTQIDIQTVVGLEPVGEFRPDRKPIRKFDDIFKRNVEKYTEQVTWKRKYRVLPDADLKKVSAKGTLTYQYCDDRQCTIFDDEPIELTLLNDGEMPPPPSVNIPLEKHPYSYKQTPTQGKKKKPDPLSFQFNLSPENAKPGEVVTLSITMHLDDDWYTYAQTQNPKNEGLPIKFDVRNTYHLIPTDGNFTPSRTPKTKYVKDGDEKKEQKVFHGTITWKQQFKVADNAESGDYGLRGQIRYQVCKNVCLMRKVKFAAGVVQVFSPSPGSPETTTTSTGDKFHIIGEASGGFLHYLLYAFLGGLIMNVMPCVLPVLAIKVLSFVKQAGEDRKQILMLNMVYSFGVIAVFLLLAVLAIILGMGWGELFQMPEFNLFMACFVFAMGLSLLGVFEIPIPGLIGSAAGGEQKEGMTGAFLTGIFATLLATPCAGPFMGTTLAWSVKQPPFITLAVWGMMGVGMASPYIVFAFFPNATKLLPKPGMWMVRFKEFSGFVLMGTVVYFIYILQKEYTVPLLIMLVGIALGLWMIGNLYDQVTHIKHKMMVRISALCLTGAICWFGYHFSQQDDSAELHWDQFSEQKIQSLRSEKKAILIDFTADWCPNCKLNEARSINTRQTQEFLEKHNITPLMADYTDRSDEIQKWLNTFDSISIPLTVIIPANQPNTAIVLSGTFSQDELIEKLNQAVELSENAAPKVAVNGHSARE